MANIYLEAWNRALDEEFGIAIATDDLTKFTKYMYESRKDHPELMQLKICMVDNEAWLVKETVEVIDAQG